MLREWEEWVVDFVFWVASTVEYVLTPSMWMEDMKDGVASWVAMDWAEFLLVTSVCAGVLTYAAIRGGLI